MADLYLRTLLSAVDLNQGFGLIDILIEPSQDIFDQAKSSSEPSQRIFFLSRVACRVKNSQVKRSNWAKPSQSPDLNIIWCAFKQGLGIGSFFGNRIPDSWGQFWSRYLIPIPDNSKLGIGYQIPIPSRVYNETVLLILQRKKVSSIRYLIPDTRYRYQPLLLS